jgi:hypothetical protein
METKTMSERPTPAEIAAIEARLPNMPSLVAADLALLVARVRELEAELEEHVDCLDAIRSTCEAAGIPGETDEPTDDADPDPAPIRTWHGTAVLVERLASALRAERAAALRGEVPHV